MAFGVCIILQVRQDKQEECLVGVTETAANLVFSHIEEPDYRHKIPPTILERLENATWTTDDLIDVIYTWQYGGPLLDDSSELVYDEDWKPFVQAVYNTDYNDIFDFDI